MNINTIDELQAALEESGVRGITFSFGRSISSSAHQGTWFANGVQADFTRFDQVRADSLKDAFNQLLSAKPVEPADKTPAENDGAGLLV